MIQARKVQYQCMSKLSAKELANRGHQFLANGDKRKSTGYPGTKERAPAQNGAETGEIVQFEHWCIWVELENWVRVRGTVW